MWASTGIAPVTVDTICFDRLTLKMVIAPNTVGTVAAHSVILCAKKTYNDIHFLMHARKWP
jgi:hypothetical protein